jgi:hypothetical protein
MVWNIDLMKLKNFYLKHSFHLGYLTKHKENSSFLYATLRRNRLTARLTREDNTKMNLTEIRYMGVN